MSEPTSTLEPRSPLEARRRTRNEDEPEERPEREFFATIVPNQEKPLFKRPKGRLGMG